MSMRTIVPLLALLACVSATPAGAQVELSDDGRTLVYRMLRGDTPTGAAARLGVPSESVRGFLREHGIADGTRVRPGFVFRVPNPLAVELDLLTARNAALEQRDAEITTKLDGMTQELERARGAASWSQAQHDRLIALELREGVAGTATLSAAIAILIAGAITVLAVGLRRRSLRYAQQLEHDLEEKRAQHLVERQRTGRELIALEEHVRDLESRLVIQARAS